MSITQHKVLAGLILFFVGTSTCLFAEPLLIGQEPVYPIEKDIQYYIDENSTLTLNDIRSNSGIINLRKGKTNYGFVRGTLWIVFNFQADAVPSGSGQIDRYLDTGTSLPTEITLYHYHQGRQIQVYETGSNLVFDTRPEFHRNFVFPVSMTQGHHQIILKIKSRNMVALIPRLRTYQNLSQFRSRDGLLLGLLYGAVVTLMAFSTIAYVWTRELIFLCASTIALCVGLWHCVQTGMGYQYIWSAYPFMNIEAQRISIVLLILSIAWLNRILSQVSTWSRLLDRLLLSAMAVTSMLIFFPLFQYVPLLGLLILSSSPAIMLIISIRASRLNLGRGGVHLAASLIFFAGLFYSLLRAYGIIPINEYSEAIGDFEFIGLFVLLSLLLANKVNEDRILKQAAIAADEAKREFLANMSHEIRTPLNAITGFTQLALNSGSAEEQRRHIKYIQQSSDNMLALVNDILDFSRMEAGKLQLELRKINLQSLLANVHSMFARTAEDKGISLVFDYDQNIPSDLMGDPLRISQVLINLVNNAVKFTERGEVRVAVSLNTCIDDLCRLDFRVSDTGIGIPAARQSRLFESFTQADSSTTRRYGGSGLGLAISQELVQLMNGEINIESEEAKGTSFYFTVELEMGLAGFPMGMRLLYVDQAGDEDEEDSPALAWLTGRFGNLKTCKFDELAAKLNAPFDYVVMDLPSDHLLTESDLNRLHNLKNVNLVVLIKESPSRLLQLYQDREIEQHYSEDIHASLQDVFKQAERNKIYLLVRKARSDALVLDNLKLLLVEDNEINQTLAVALLERVNIDVHLANNGEEAISRLRDENFDLVLMDMQMPVMDGLKATRLIRNSLNLDRLPVIAMTANAMRSSLDQCLEAGMNDYVTKPIDPKLLYQTIDRWAGKTVDESAADH